MSENITIRPAVAEDGLLAADLIFSTGPQVFDSLFYRFSVTGKTDSRTFRRKYGSRGLYRMTKFTDR